MTLMKRKVLCKILVMFLAAVILPSFAIGALAIRHSTQHILRQVDLSSSNFLEEKKASVEQQVSEINSLMDQIIAGAQYKALMGPFKNETDLHIAMSGVIRSFNNLLAANRSIASIYLINRNKSYILSDAKYSPEAFYDKEALTEYTLGSLYGLAPRKVTFSWGVEGGRRVITFVRSLNDFTSGDRIDLLINVDYLSFSEKLQSVENPYKMDLLVFNESSSLIFNQTGMNPSVELIKRVNSFNSGEEKLFISREEYYCSKTYSGKLGWTFAYVKPYSKVVGTVELLNNVIRTTILVALALALAMAVFFSISLYRPLGSLVTQVNGRSRYPLRKGWDEYSVIGAAFSRLMNEKDILQSCYEKAYPYIKQHSVRELLNGNIWDPAKWDSITELLDIRFTGKRFVVAVLNFESQVNSSLDTEVETLMNQHAQTCLVSPIDGHQMAVIVNTDNDDREIRAAFEELKSILDSMAARVTISLSGARQGLNELSRAYQEALQLMGSRFFTGKNRVISMEDIHQGKLNGEIDRKRLQDEILDCIRAQNPQKALTVLNKFIRTAAGEFPAITYIKYAAFQLSSGLRESLAEALGRVEPQLEWMALWNGIQEAETLDELELFLEDFLSKCAEAAADIKKKQHRELTEKIKELIRLRYSEDLSVRDIAVTVYLSPNYLSTVFKEETGITIIEYLTQIRMDAAQEMLREGDVRIQEVARAIGYNNVQSFIRFFKKAYRMTPVEYRRNLVLDKN